MTARRLAGAPARADPRHRPAHRRPGDRARRPRRRRRARAGVRDRRLRARAHRGRAQLPGRRGAPRRRARSPARSSRSAAGGSARPPSPLAESGDAALDRGLLHRPRRRRGQRRADPPPDPDRRARSRCSPRSAPGGWSRAPTPAACAGSRRRRRRSPTATSRTRSRSTPATRWASSRSPSTRCRSGSRVLDSARKEFIANASHELRTPIFSLSGFVELLDEEDPDPEARAEFVRTMREQVDRLTKLTVDLLDLSKLDADAIQMRREPVELADVARRVAAEFGPTAERHRTAITIGPTARAPPASPTRTGSRRSCVS